MTKDFNDCYVSPNVIWQSSQKDEMNVSYVNDGLILQCILKNRMYEFGLVSAGPSRVQ